MKFFLLSILLLTSQAWGKWSVSSYNIRNFDNDYSAGRTDLVELEKIIKSMKSDVMTFQEVVNTSAFESLVRKVLPGYETKISSCGGSGKQKLAVVFDPKVFKFITQSEDFTFSGNGSSCGSLRPLFLVTLEEKTSKENYVFGVVHLKAGGNSRAMQQRWKQYLNLEKVSSTYARKNLILLGDFNTTGYNIKDQDFVKFEDFLKEAGFRTMSENLGCTNYWHGGNTNGEYISSILDHVVIQQAKLSSVLEVKVGSHCAKEACRPASPETLGTSFESVSDHCPVQVSFK